MVKKVKKDIKKGFKIDKNLIIALIVILIVIVGFYITYKKEVLFNPEDEYMMESDMDYVEENSYMMAEDTYVEEDDSFIDDIIDVIKEYLFGYDGDMMMEGCEDVISEIMGIRDGFDEIDMGISMMLENMVESDEDSSGINGGITGFVSYTPEQVESFINKYSEMADKRIDKNKNFLTHGPSYQKQLSELQERMLDMKDKIDSCERDDKVKTDALAKLKLATDENAELSLRLVQEGIFTLRDGSLESKFKNHIEALKNHKNELARILEDLNNEVVSADETFNNAKPIAEKIFNIERKYRKLNGVKGDILERMDNLDLVFTVQEIKKLLDEVKEIISPDKD